MATAGTPFWKDDEIVVDKDGIPHFTGTHPHLMREYRKRVLFAYSMLEGDGDTEEKERRDLEKKKKRFAKRLLDCLHGEAWRCCQELMQQMDELQKPDGYKLIFKALQSIERVTVVKKTEQFDKFFERGQRRRGQGLDEYLRGRKQDWADLQDLDENTKMSDDLLAYFILKQSGLSREDRRQILLASQSKYDLDSIEQAMRVSYFDVHEKEKARAAWDSRPKGFGKSRRAYYMDEEQATAEDGDQTEEQFEEEWHAGDAFLVDDQMNEETELVEEAISDAGASNDDEVFDAYMAYKDSRRKLKEVQKQRGFYKNADGGASSTDRQEAIKREKARTRCGTCNRLGHWSGDPECPGAQKGSGKKSKGKGKGKSKGKRSGGRAYLASEQPLLFTLGQDEEDEAFCHMVRDEDAENDMQQDAGFTEQDLRRKKAMDRMPSSPTASEGWSKVSLGSGYVASDLPTPWDGSSSSLPQPAFQEMKMGQKVEEKQMPVVTHEKAQVKVITVPDMASVAKSRSQLQGMTVRQLQEDCSFWGIKLSGTKAEIIKRLEDFYAGTAIQKTGCTRQFVMIEEEKKVERDLPRGSGKGSLGKTGHHAYMISDSPGSSSVNEVEESPKSGRQVIMFPQAVEDHGRFFRRSRADGIMADLERSGSIRAVPINHQTSDSTNVAFTAGRSVRPLQVGEVLPGVRCGVCNSDLVVRQNRTSLKLFFGCSKFGKTNCRFSFEYDEGLALARRAAAERFP